MAFRVIQTPGERQAVGIQPCGEHLALAVADPNGHPFDLDPTLLDGDRVAELRDAITDWLDQRWP